EFDFNAIGNLPLVDDKLAARLAVGHQENGGWVDNELTGKDMLSSDQWIGRGKVLWTPVENLRVLFSAEYFDYDGVGPANKLVSITPFVPGVFNPFGAAQLEALLESGFTDDGTQYADGREYDLALNQKPKTDTTTQTYSGTATLDTAWGTLKGIGAYRKVRTRSAVDNDGTPYQIFDVPFIRSTVDQWSGELQASGNAYDDRLAWTVGAFYFTEDGYDDLAGIVVPFVLPQFSTLRFQGSDIENSSEAAYTQGTFKVTPELSVTLGLRYSVDRRHKRQYQEILDPTNPNCDPALTPESDLDQCSSPKFKRKDSDTNYTFSIDYKLTPDMMVYAKTARGFRAGGFNSRQGADQEDGGSFGPETVTDYEVGFKSQLFEDRARFNTAIFYSDYEDIQSTLLTINPATNQPITLVQNAAKARIFGFEVEAEAILFTNFRVSAAAGYTDPEYKDFEDLSGDRSDEKFPLSPKWTASASAQYTNNLEVGRLLVRADYAWKDKIVFMQNLNPPFTEAKSYGVLNGRIALAFSDGKYEVAAYGRNLLDEDYKVFALDLESSGLGFISNQYGQPRQYGVEVSARFGQ
ncbi:MAG: TonB-dependent receptor, partial [Steroidobacteraceae bacterium]